MMKKKGKDGKEDGPERSRGSEINAQKGKAEKTGLSRKKVMFVADDWEVQTESILLKYIFRKEGADGESGVIGYSSFLSEPSEQDADVFILRSARMFDDSGENLESLKRSLTELRRANPDSVIIVFAINYSNELNDLAKPESGVIDELNADWTPGTDNELVRRALKMLEKKQD